jgi:hypothetical protein
VENKNWRRRRGFRRGHTAEAQAQFAITLTSLQSYSRSVPASLDHTRRTKFGLSSLIERTPHCCIAARVSIRSSSRTRSTPG